MKKLLQTIFLYSKNERGIAHLFIIILLIAGLVIGVYLVQTRTNLLPKASNQVSGPISGPVGMDSDNDGFTDTQETFMGTSLNRACAVNNTDHAWPADINNDRNVNGADVSMLMPYISGSTPYNKRYDLNQDGKIDQAGDIAVIQKYMLKTCAPVSHTASLRFIVNGNSFTPGQQIPVNVVVHSPSEEINLVSAQINYPKDLLEVTGITLAPTFTREFENYFDNNNGTISIISGVTPGVKSANNIAVATVTFRLKASGVATLNFDATSELLRDSDGENIFNNALTPESRITIQPAPTIAPTAVPSALPSSTPTSAPTSMPTPVSTATPIPSAAVTACTLTKAEWVAFVKPAQSNTTAGLRVEATGNCADKQVDFTLVEDDGLLGNDPVRVEPQSITLISTNQPNVYAGTTTWITEFQEDGVFGAGNPPEYRFSARLAGETTAINSDLFIVLREAGIPDHVRGDVNADGVANLKDLSWLLSNWNKPVNNDLIDVRQDGVINTFDVADLVSILRQLGVLRSQ